MRHPYVVTNYAELRNWADKFARGDLYGLVCYGPPGLSKSFVFRNAFAEAKAEYIVVKAKLTPFDLYKRLHDNPTSLVFADDTPAMLRNPDCVLLMMSVAEHEPTKVIQWNSSAIPDDNGDEATGLKKSFESTSRLLLVVNKLDLGDEELEPVLSRCQIIRFEPHLKAVHEYVGTWFRRDKRTREIYEYIGDNLDLIPTPDIRDYTGSVELYDINWREVLAQRWTGDPRLSAAVSVLNDPSLKTKAAKTKRFNELTGENLSPAQVYRELSRVSRRA